MGANFQQTAPARYGQSVIYHPLTGKIYLFGGKGSSSIIGNDLWVISLDRSYFTSLPPTTAAASSTMTTATTPSTNNTGVSPTGGTSTVASPSKKSDSGNVALVCILSLH